MLALPVNVRVDIALLESTNMSTTHPTISSDINSKSVGDLIDRIYALAAMEEVDFRLKVILDSGTGLYIVNIRAYYKELRELPTAKYIKSAKGTRTPL